MIKTFALPGPECAIGEVSRMTGLSLRAIRLYEAHGLVAPRRTADHVRRYGAADRARLQLIARLRGVGLRLDDIAAILDSPGRPAAGGVQRERAAEALARRIGQLEAALARARDLQREFDAPADQAA